MKRLILILLLLVLLCVIAAQSASACPVCYTDPNSQTSNAVSYAVVALLGVTGSVLSGLVGVFLFLRRRAKKMTLDGTIDYPSVN